MTSTIAEHHHKKTSQIDDSWESFRELDFDPLCIAWLVSFSLGGWIANTAQGAVLELEGGVSTLEKFQSALKTQAPPAAQIQEMVSQTIPEEGGRWTLLFG